MTENAPRGKTPEIGEKAPNFTLPDSDMNPRRLSDFEGKKVVLAFFVSAFTSICTKEMCTFRDTTDRLIDLKAQVIGISVNDPFSNKEFKEKNRLTFPVLSDHNREVIKEYNLQMPDFAGLKGYIAAKRCILVLDRESVVRYRWISEDPTVEPDYAKIEQVLNTIQ
ncbi:MAG: peroxiredoxin [Candidatus Bathyarchaeota archaeon]|nr:peroxiredoxin [Candidatus Bathyarchaeota archaeon]